MKDGSQSILITQYQDYVPYLKDLVTFKKKEEGFTFRSFCKKSGFKSPTYLKWVLDEVRPVSPKSAGRFAKGLGLGKREQRYFELLVHYKDSPEPGKKKFFFEELLRYQEDEQKPVVQDRYEYLSHWYYVTIRELVAHPNFKEDPEWIRQKLYGSVSLWEVKHAMHTLQRLGLIVRDNLGRWSQNDAELHTGKEVESLAAYNYHFESLGLSREVLQHTSHRMREYSSLVALLDHESFLELKQKMLFFQTSLVADLRRKMKMGMGQGVPLEVFMLNMQLFPVTQFERNPK
ncbi:MAG: hypothetical protein A3G32_07215 [Deltaproteobacteria bacterium RIFCSPLOWO2_12_FULL_40_28]|nr:MAG: hypothetical protein A3C45_07260 [Deltaproteobacteria bacterium RIFCSPHIGHO2_02_FULL_40_28]OGQ19255.1 MAG: hypothetical protein A3E27_04555 [Deltaproteobacteria bacterium RIFCSPHIGHO2_12_FULL_40_32]OGQ40522.1 MAG: hypothetical protein A3I69_00515 [Deltaproteobacteria bacterium RIFCSPLOWO2_02_FULL_40_36]OGQ53757.1 MAG: hypothetical protein A3G32_07215 [Deltaproteobacteria bacterium RIFCSPLOWO2_12_FULL_40_28]